MKKSIFLSAIIAFFAMTLNAQTPRETAVKQDIKDLKKQETGIKKEVRKERKALRKLEGKDVSSASKRQFVKDFGNVPVLVWERSNNFDEATFSKDGQALTAYYDADAQLVGTGSHKSFSDLPLKAQNYISEKFAGYTIGEVFLFDDNPKNETDMTLYGRQFEDADNYFVELTMNNKKIVERVNLSGDVTYFMRLK